MDVRIAVDGLDFQVNEDVHTWRENPPAGALLRADLLSGRISMDTNVHPPFYVYRTRPEYRATDPSKFACRLKHIREQLRVQQNLADTN